MAFHCCPGSPETSRFQWPSHINLPWIETTGTTYYALILPDFSTVCCGYLRQSLFVTLSCARTHYVDKLVSNLQISTCLCCARIKEVCHQVQPVLSCKLKSLFFQVIIENRGKPLCIECSDQKSYTHKHQTNSATGCVCVKQ